LHAPGPRQACVLPGTHLGAAAGARCGLAVTFSTAPSELRIQVQFVDAFPLGPSHDSTYVACWSQPVTPRVRSSSSTTRRLATSQCRSYAARVRSCSADALTQPPTSTPSPASVTVWSVSALRISDDRRVMHGAGARRVPLRTAAREGSS